MCIVSFVLDKGKFILTFNRDEHPLRESEEPRWINSGKSQVFCPIDKIAGGTWIGYNKKIVACLQNGALVRHKRHPPYRKSRGLILMEILNTDYPEDFISNYNLEGIEPFTLSIFSIELNLLSVYRYDGINLTVKKNSLKKPLILSSCTLYAPGAQKEIESDFFDNLKDANSLFDFNDEHRIGKDKNKYTDLVSTVNITQFITENDQFRCQYYDLKSGGIIKTLG